jgi:cell division protein FtsB
MMAPLLLREMQIVNARLTLFRHIISMVIRTRIAAILLPLAFYVFSGVVGAFFIWHAAHGERGIEADREYRRQMSAVEAELKTVRAEKAQWQKRIALLRGPQIDRDLLDEEARNLLNRVNRSDVVVLLPATGGAEKTR